LVKISQTFGIPTVQTFDRLPSGWTILYELARLDGQMVEELVRQRVIHPLLKLNEARALADEMCGRRGPGRPRLNLKQRLGRFADFVFDTMSEWTREERELATQELTRLLEVIDETGRKTPFPRVAAHCERAANLADDFLFNASTELTRLTA
jgi:hypothetical protein